jgi:hypothetical protein
MLCVATASEDVEHCAVRVLPEPPSGSPLQPTIRVTPSLKSTLPVGRLPVTVAVNVTLWPLVDGLRLLATCVVVGAGPPPPAAATAAPAFTMPAPHSEVVQLHLPFCGFGLHAAPVVGNVRAVVCSFDSTCEGVSEAFTESMSDTTPLTCGVAMLVPAYCT